MPHPNEYSWNAKANVLYVENPAGVGFNLGYTGEHLDDEIAGDQEYAFILNWFAKFPEFKQNDLYITGESYGGIYVPYLAYRLHSNNQTTSSGGSIKLKGIAVGNGVTDWEVDCDPAYIEMSWYHGLIPRTLKEKIDSNNCQYRVVGQKPLSQVCKDALKEWSKYTRGVNVYDVYKSPQDGGLMEDSIEKYMKGETKLGYTPFLTSNKHAQPFTSKVTDYMDRADVRRILHVAEKTTPFEPCVNFNYEMLEKATLWIYPILKEGGYRILKYSGDTDGAVPTYGTEKWIDKLNWPIKQEHRPFYMDGKVAGYYEIREGLDFIVFHGAGHLVPLWLRKESQFVLYAWINHGKFPY
uniref:Carboxypeptidase n=1 Tax=Euplotes harpa TaxID=151035 RepID=A0A7S3J3J6_9SPIT|mmetsp:Transcript_17875/g.20654  ORF Transcript_17875/g.20654 Transcript_17875/m.20654 type:complete len:353 (+) Transcript_17875:311-1369(+)